MVKRFAPLASWLSDNRGSVAAWLGLGCLAQAVATASAAPSVVWPAAGGLGLLVYSCANVAIDYLAGRRAGK